MTATLTNGTINATYTYDANGNLEGGDKLHAYYTSFNKPWMLHRPLPGGGTGPYVTFSYDAENQRLLQSR